MKKQLTLTTNYIILQGNQKMSTVDTLHFGGPKA